MREMREEIAATLFRQVPGGYVYREPYRWPFGQPRHYLVNSDQRTTLLDLIVSKRPILSQVILWGTLCLMVAIACAAMWLYTGHDSPTVIDALGIIVLTVTQVVVALALHFWWERRRLEAQYATFTPTDLRITQSEMRAAATNTRSFKQMIFTGVAAACGSTAMLVDGAIQLASLQLTGLLPLGVSLMLAGLAWYYLRQVLSRAER